MQHPWPVFIDVSSTAVKGGYGSNCMSGAFKICEEGNLPTRKPVEQGKLMKVVLELRTTACWSLTLIPYLSNSSGEPHLVHSHPCCCYHPAQHRHVSWLSFVPSRTNA